jgi:hypothetical protein
LQFKITLLKKQPLKLFKPIIFISTPIIQPLKKNLKILLNLLKIKEKETFKLFNENLISLKKIRCFSLENNSNYLKKKLQFLLKSHNSSFVKTKKKIKLIQKYLYLYYSNFLFFSKGTSIIKIILF